MKGSGYWRSTPAGILLSPVGAEWNSDSMLGNPHTALRNIDA